MHKRISKQKLRIRGQGAAGYTDKEIMQDLKLKLMQILKERYTRLFRSLEQSNLSEDKASRWRIYIRGSRDDCNRHI
jgi:hypothetical protein